jgi:flagellar M-ring protein FliF
MDEISKLIAGLSRKQRISIVIVLLMVGGGMWGLTRWKHETDFRPLYSSMSAEDAAAVVQKLKETGVEYRLTDNGSGVLVASAKLAESRLALASAGLPKSGRIGFELFDKTNFGATELVEHVNYQRALEGELERTVISISEVEQARVHISLSKDSVFLDQQEPAKASVMIKLRIGARIAPQNVTAISQLVASAVPGLTPDAVAVLDTDGRLLSRPYHPNNDGSQITSETLDLRQQLERDLVSKISSTLEPLLGADRFRAGAFVDCDLTSAELQEETFDPTKSVMASSQKTEDSTDRASTSGIPGTASNLPRPPSPIPGGGGEVNRRTENVQYETSRVVRKTRIPQGLIKRMSLSVVVAQQIRWQGDGKSRRRVVVPTDPETLKSIRELVAGVTGFSPDRGDQLIVDSLPFEGNLSNDPLPAPAPAPETRPQWLQVLNRYWQVVLLAVLGLAAVAVVLGVSKSTRKSAVHDVDLKREIPAGAQTPEVAAPHSADMPALTPAEASVADHILGQIRQSAQKDPRLAANVLRMWMQESK